MYLCIYVVICEKSSQNLRIRCSHTLTVEIFKTRICLSLWNSQRYAAASETKFLKHIHFKALFCNLIIAHNTDVCRTYGHSLGNIIVAQKNNLCRKIRCTHKKLALFLTHCHTCFLQQLHTLLVQTALCLNRNPQHYLFFHIIKNKKPAFEESRPYNHTQTTLTLDFLDSP